MQDLESREYNYIAASSRGPRVELLLMLTVVASHRTTAPQQPGVTRTHDIISHLLNCEIINNTTVMLFFIF